MRAASANRLCSAFFGAVSLLLAGAAGCATRAPVPPARFGEMTTLAGSRTDKGVEGHGFTEIYERMLFPLRDEPIRILEIGVAEGGSIGLWQDYFPNARIFGLDIDDKSAMDSERVTTFVADQASREQLGAFVAAHGGDFDFILDDGGHSMEQQQVSFGYLFQYVKPGGFYIIEDVHTSLSEYWPGYGGEEGGGNTTLTMISEFMRRSEIRSQYMTPEEQRSLTGDIEYCNLFFRPTSEHSMTCVFKKKAQTSLASAPSRSIGPPPQPGRPATCGTTARATRAARS